MNGSGPRMVCLRVRKLPQQHWTEFPADAKVVIGQDWLVETQSGREIAQVVCFDDRQRHPRGDGFVLEILRPLTPEDRAQRCELVAFERQAHRVCREKIVSLRLSMRLATVESTFCRSKLIFYFTSENKVDFRELLRFLSGQFRPARIELKQIGVRDETRALGGIGCCGKMVCCRQFLVNFHPVATKMAKDQNMSLNPAKLSGICGKLLCCLSYEHKFYAEFQGRFPKLGAEIRLVDGPARVIDLNYLTQRVFISYPDRRKVTVPLDQVKGRKCPHTGRNLWWVIDPERPEWEPDFPPPPVSKKKQKSLAGGPGGGPRPAGGEGPRSVGGDARPDRVAGGTTPDAHSAEARPSGAPSSDGRAERPAAGRPDRGPDGRGGGDGRSDRGPGGRPPRPGGGRPERAADGRDDRPGQGRPDRHGQDRPGAGRYGQDRPGAGRPDGQRGPGGRPPRDRFDRGSGRGPSGTDERPGAGGSAEPAVPAGGGSQPTGASEGGPAADGAGTVGTPAADRRTDAASPGAGTAVARDRTEPGGTGDRAGETS